MECTLSNPHFFKIILPDTLDDYKLVIPEKFVRKYGNDFEDSVFLKVPSGDKWRVELVRSDDDVYLGNGLEEFVRHYSVDYGHFVVFEYRSKSCFDVVLFDTSASEVDYPILGNGSRTSCLKATSADVVDVDLTLEDDNSPLRCKRKGADVAFDFASPSKVATSIAVGRDTNDVVNSNKERKNSAGRRPMSSQKRRLKMVTKRSRPLTGKGRANALKRALEFFKPNSPFFMAVLQPSYINKPLAIPSQFAEIFLKEKVGHLVLKVLGRGTWTVTYRVYSDRKDSTFRLNWNVFVLDNDLKLGDVCIFEVIGAVQLELKVSIYRETEYTNCSKALANGSVTNGIESPEYLKIKDEKQRKEIVETARMNYADKPSSSNGHRDAAAANNSTSTYPSFEVVMTPRNVNYNWVAVPASFVKIHMKGIGRNSLVSLRFGKRLWSASLRKCPGTNIAVLSSGWIKFARENGVEAGDICKFKLIQCRIKPILLHVSVIKQVL